MPKHETSEDTEENEWMVCNFQGCGRHNTSTVAYIECEEAFPSEIYAQNKGVIVLASEHNVGFLVDCDLDCPAFDKLGTSHLGERVNLQPGYVPIKFLVHKNDIRFTTGIIIMTVQAFVLFIQTLE
jgi:hypothetical protein